MEVKLEEVYNLKQNEEKWQNESLLEDQQGNSGIDFSPSLPSRNEDPTLIL